MEVGEGKTNPLWSKPQIVKEQARSSHSFPSRHQHILSLFSPFLANDQWVPQSSLVLLKFAWLPMPVLLPIHISWMPHFKFSRKKFRQFTALLYLACPPSWSYTSTKATWDSALNWASTLVVEVTREGEENQRYFSKVAVGLFLNNWQPEEETILALNFALTYCKPDAELINAISAFGHMSFPL